jgi:hypothetical protein
VSNARRTDFELYGIANDEVVIRGRSWVFTVDFEAFAPAEIDMWIAAMDRWAEVSARRGWRSSVFLALEDVVRLKALGPRDYPRFLQAARRMAEAGARFYPHNHGVFDEHTGHLRPGRPGRVEGYRKRPSMFFDVVYRHGLDIGEWIAHLWAHYTRFLDDAELPLPRQPAFRAGGWDHGTTEADARAFVSGLTTAGFAWDTSACAGTYGTRTWRAQTPFGRNVFGLTPTLTEAAPCWSVDALGRLSDPRTAHAVLKALKHPKLWLRSPGVFVTVFHFNNLFRADVRRGKSSIAVPIEGLFSKIGAFRSLLRLPSITFEDIDAERA